MSKLTVIILFFILCSIIYLDYQSTIEIINAKLEANKWEEVYNKVRDINEYMLRNRMYKHMGLACYKP